jgi:hypothetical protein
MTEEKKKTLEDLSNFSTYKPHKNRLEDFAIIESTLREGEQFMSAFFNTEQ